MPLPDDDQALLTAAQCAQAMVANQRWAARLAWDAYGQALAVLLQTDWTGPGAAAFARAVARHQAAEKLSVDGIIGPVTWERLRAELAPPASLTGVTVTGAPSVPNGLGEIIATFGDPRKLIGPDGLVSRENELAWERQILGRGKLPFAIPLDPRKPGEVKATFYAHRKLVGAFEAVFQELNRLGLRQRIHSWGGIYSFRSIRGSSSNLSLHAFGAAIDLNAETNQLGTAGDMDPGVVGVFAHFGFVWGGDFRSRPDPMHFQYATGY
jgi:hypothetical protein